MRYEAGGFMIGPASSDEEEETRELFVRHVRTQRKGKRLSNHEEALTDFKYAGALILDLLASKTMRKHCLLYKPPRLRYFVIAGQSN